MVGLCVHFDAIVFSIRWNRTNPRMIKLITSKAYNNSPFAKNKDKQPAKIAKSTVRVMAARTILERNTSFLILVDDSTKPHEHRKRSALNMRNQPFFNIKEALKLTADNNIGHTNKTTQILEELIIGYGFGLVGLLPWTGSKITFAFAWT